MSDIKVRDLNPAGSEFFQDSENFLNDLNDMDTNSVYGGQGTSLTDYFGFGTKLLEYGILGYGINNIASLALNFSNLGGGIGGNGGNGDNGGSTSVGV